MRHFQLKDNKSSKFWSIKNDKKATPRKVIVNYDPTAHAEIEAIRDACRNLKINDLTGCELYSTSKPCRMCETAGYWANISRFYFGANIVDGASPQYSSC